MLEKSFCEVYAKFKLHFYQKIFSRFSDREATLTTVETFCVEMIHALGKPTVNEFASFARISPPNAAYKINHLVQKGYLTKVQSEEDKREYFLEVTQKFYDYYNVNYQYMQTVIQRIRDRFSEEEQKQFEHILTVISEELMPEIPVFPPTEPETVQKS